MSVAVGIGYIGTRTEDAIVEHLGTVVSADDATVLAAYTTTELPEASVVVVYTGSRSATEAYQPNARIVDVDVQIRTHADADLADARATHAELVNTVTDALHAAELHTTLNALGVAGIVFWQVCVGDVTRGQVDNAYITRVRVEVGASWVSV